MRKLKIIEHISPVEEVTRKRQGGTFAILSYEE
jgi:hypothetical protein